jgi:hypothetical protein
MHYRKVLRHYKGKEELIEKANTGKSPREKSPYIRGNKKHFPF